MMMSWKQFVTGFDEGYCKQTNKQKNKQENKSKVLEKESVDLKVLVYANIPNYEKEPLIAVKRDNL